MAAPKWDQAAWFKSTRSAGNGSCVEVAFVAQTVGVKDSKDPRSPVLEFTSSSWAAFARGVAEGRLD